MVRAIGSALLKLLSMAATEQIIVNPAVPAPSLLSYPQASITGTVGKAIAPDIPSFTGSVTSFSISPGLPAGLSLDPSSGAISGTPTVTMAPTSYTVTASNSGGSTTAGVSIAVNKAYTTVLELGHGASVTLMRSITGRILSQDQSGHWALWDSNADSELARGDQYLVNATQAPWAVDMAGTTIAIGQPNGLEVRSTVDGHVLSLIDAPNMIDPVTPSWTASPTKAWWRLASDGSYIRVR